MENVSENTRCFISGCVNQFLYSDKIKANCSNSERSYFYARDSSLLKLYDVQQIEDRYTRDMSVRFDELIHESLTESRQYEENLYPFLYYSGFFMDCFIVGDFKEFLIEVVHSSSREELLDICRRKNSVISARSIDKTYEENTNIIPMKNHVYPRKSTKHNYPSSI